MIHWIVTFCLRQRPIVLLATLIMVGLGVWSAVRLPIDAVPDITNVQVQVNTAVPALAPEEIERLVTYPIETEMSGLPGMTELRSLSKFGLSQVTMVFADGTDIYRLRQLVAERLQNVQGELPADMVPRLAPIATGLGEIFYYSVSYADHAAHAPATEYERLMQLKLLHDYQIKPLLRQTPGLAEVNVTGGYEKQIVVSPDPQKLTSVGLTLAEVADKLKENTENAGGGLLEIGGEQIVVRGNTRVRTAEEIAGIPLKFGSGVQPILVGDVASVGIGSSFRTGTGTSSGHEAVIGAAIMLTGENSRIVSKAVGARLREIQEKLPEGVIIKPLYDRSDLVNATIGTVEKSLFEGALLVVVVLMFMLGNWRAACIVALAIPLSMFVAVTGMVETHVSGNLMSLGAIDFGLIIDGAVVIVENIIRHLAEQQQQAGRPLSAGERRTHVLHAAKEVANPMFFGVLIITVVYVPILALSGVEGKMFRPMALTVIFALVGALVLALSLMPVLCSWLLRGRIREKDSFLVVLFKKLYTPVLHGALNHRLFTAALMFAMFGFALHRFTKLGAEFIPQLDEGSITLQFIRSSSAGLTASLELQEKSEKLLKEKFPEITEIFSRIGTAEIALDPMGPNVADTYVMLRPPDAWRHGPDGRPLPKAALAQLMRAELELKVPGQAYLISQPIQLRFNEIMAGARANLVCKIFGDDYDQLTTVAKDVRTAIMAVPGAGEVEFDALGKNPILEITPDRAAMRQYAVQAADVNAVITAALAGEETGSLVEGNRRYPIVVRLTEKLRENLDALRRLPLRTDHGGLLTLGQVAKVEVVQAVGQVTRENGQRRVAILINPQGRDTQSFVTEAMQAVKDQVKFPDGYYFEFGGQFQNLIEARQRLMVVVPAALALIFVLIFLSFGSVRQAALIFTCVPLAVTGGIFALWCRGMPFTISAGVGFIALSGIAVLNGIMLISFINQLRQVNGMALRAAIVQGTLTRLRPKLMTALVASLGFIPMALATGAGAEVQRPLATVVIGGIITSTLLTLVLLPALYEWLEQKGERQRLAVPAA